jgi:choline dehydrogenase-like flavoprotein
MRAALYNRKISGIRDLFRNALGMARYLVPLMWKYIWDHRVFVPSTAKILMHVQAEHAPLAESRITIDSSAADSFGLARVVLDWRLAGNELASLREFAIQIRDALQSSGIGQLKIDEDLLSLNPHFLSKLGDTYHQAGGTNMAASEQDGVVDKNLRVFGTDNLYVIGASVFPTTSNANTTFTALAFTTRLIDYLAGATPLK